MILLVGLAIGAIAEAADVKSPAEDVTITDIRLEDNLLRVKVLGVIKYTLYKPADPLLITLEIEAASVGQFGNKIVSKAKGVTEIVPVQVDTPAKAARLNIYLQTQADVRAEIKEDELILTIQAAAVARPKADTASATKSEPVKDITDILVEKGTEKPAAEKPLEEKQATEALQKQAAATAITEFSFDKDKGLVELIIKADGKLPEPAVYQINNTVVIELANIKSKAVVPTNMVAPVKDISVRYEGDKLKIVITAEAASQSEVFILDDELLVDFVVSGSKSKKAVAEGPAVQDKIVNGTKVISLDFQDADIVPILRLLGDVSGYNMVVHPDVRGRITMKLMNVPWTQALDIVIKTFNLEKVVEGNIIRVATSKAFQEEKKAMAENKELFGKAEDIVTKVFTVNNANVEKIKDSIDKGKILSPRGTISFDVRTRSLIVKDIQERLDDLQRLLDVLDKPTRQVLIEARIVEMNSNYAESLGVEWGFMGKTTPKGGTIASSGGSSGGKTVPGGGYDVINPVDGSVIRTINIPPAVNLPAATSTLGPTSAVTFGFLNAAETLGLNLRLSAVEAQGKGKVVSSPKIMTLDNQEAIIKQGKKIPVTTMQSGTSGVATFSTQYIDANLKLIVTPQITPDGSVLMKVDITKDAPDYSQTDLQKNPAIDTKQATTQVILRNGETIVIGGIMSNIEQESTGAVPGISKIPLLGELFKNRTKEITNTEMLIFVTPRIMQ